MAELREVGESMIRVADVGGDGQINYGEFMKMTEAEGFEKSSGAVALRI